MNRIADAELGLTVHNVYMDYLKSDYVLAAQNLMWIIFDSEKDMTPESENEIKDKIRYLLNSKENLTDAIGMCIELVDKLSHEVEDYLMEVKNDMQ